MFQLSGFYCTGFLLKKPSQAFVFSLRRGLFRKPCYFDRSPLWQLILSSVARTHLYYSGSGYEPGVYVCLQGTPN